MTIQDQLLSTIKDNLDRILEKVRTFSNSSNVLHRGVDDLQQDLKNADALKKLYDDVSNGMFYNNPVLLAVMISEIHKQESGEVVF